MQTAEILVDEYQQAVDALARWPRRRIVALTVDARGLADTALRRDAFARRRELRGPSKLARRMRRNVALGRAGAF